MPDKYFYALAAGGTTVAGVTYKLRMREILTLKEWAVLCVALALWGVAAYAVLAFYFPDEASREVRVGLAIPLGVGISELFALVILAGKTLINDVPILIEEYVRKKK